MTTTTWICEFDMIDENGVTLAEEISFTAEVYGRWVPPDHDVGWRGGWEDVTIAQVKLNGVTRTQVRVEAAEVPLPDALKPYFDRWLAEHMYLVYERLEWAGRMWVDECH